MEVFATLMFIITSPTNVVTAMVSRTHVPMAECLAYLSAPPPGNLQPGWDVNYSCKQVVGNPTDTW